MTEVWYPELADAIEAHAAALGVTFRTAKHHIEHEDWLLSALGRPAQHAHYRAAGIVAQAAVLAHGLCTNHGFVDGNKRTAWLLTLGFLEMNGYRLRRPHTTGHPVEVTRDWLVGLTTRAVTAEQFENWLRRHLTRIEPRV